MVAVIISLILDFLTLTAYANSIHLGVGIGGNTKQQDSRNIDILYNYKLENISWMSQGYNIGLYTSKINDSWYIFRVYRVYVRPGDWELGLTLGAGLHFTKGPRLGSHFQFTEDLSIFYRYIGIGYKHISNAGIQKPNLGRDFLMLKIRLEW